MSILSDFDHYLLGEGTHYRSYLKLGAQVGEWHGRAGTNFTVWAPNAASVSVIGDFNDWSPGAHPMERSGWSGVWERFIPDARPGALYKYLIAPKDGGRPLLKADPYAFGSERPPGNASRIVDLSGYDWGDSDWLARRQDINAPQAPQAIYECHLGSWRRDPSQPDRLLSYRELAPMLADYAANMGYTHVEFMPLAEHPFGGSWGYQSTGYYSPTSRYGTPHDLMFLIDTLHRHGLGVILDWVPAHFPDDKHGLAEFDGSHLYEAAHPSQRENPEWDTLTFDFGKPHVRTFLISNALYWLDRFHVDGLRVDAVSAMVFLDYGRGPGEWVPNRYGGRENIEAMEFLRAFNDQVHKEYPGVLTIAEETHGFPNVTLPTPRGGLGFDLKWDVGWVHDTVDAYLDHPPHDRPDRYGRLMQRRTYDQVERFVLPLSHDESKKGKGSLLARFPGDDWQRRATLRLLLGYMYTLSGKKLLFMGDDFGQWREWDHDRSLDWHLLDDPRHASIARWARDLNTTYRAVPALHELDLAPGALEWVEDRDSGRSVLAFLRPAAHSKDLVLVACNFRPEPRHSYRLGVPRGGEWEEILNSDAPLYGGSGQGNIGGVSATPAPSHGRPYSLNVVVPPLGMVAFRNRG